MTEPGHEDGDRWMLERLREMLQGYRVRYIYEVCEKDESETYEPAWEHKLITLRFYVERDPQLDPAEVPLLIAGLEDMKAGRVRSLAEIDAELERRRIPSDQA